MLEFEILEKEVNKLFEGKENITFSREQFWSFARHTFNVGLNEGLDCVYDEEKREMFLGSDPKYWK